MSTPSGAFPGFGARLAAIRRRIERTAPDPAAVTLLAVTKGFGPEAVTLRAALTPAQRNHQGRETFAIESQGMVEPGAPKAGNAERGERNLTLAPIGVVRTPFLERASAPRQGFLAGDVAGQLVLERGKNFGFEEQVALPLAMARSRPDLIHFTSLYVPLIAPA